MGKRYKNALLRNNYIGEDLADLAPVTVICR